jgi:hypothetical protein
VHVLVEVSLAALLAGSAPVGSPHCPAIRLSELMPLIEAVPPAPSESERALRVTKLTSVWKGHCPAARAAAGRNVVEGLAGLLKWPYARLLTASMLIDVSTNLRYARRPLEAAIADQKAIQRRWAREAYPLIPSDRISASLRCVEHKIKTGRHSRLLCQDLDHLDSDSE